MPHASSLPNDLKSPITGIGSLPFTLSEEAIRFVIDLSPEIPYWPQLPRRRQGEGMIQQFVAQARPFLAARERQVGYAITERNGFLEALAASEGALDVEHASGFFAFCEALRRERFPHARVLKGQLTGPWTLASTLYTGQHPALQDEPLRAALVNHLSLVAAWQVGELSRFRRPILMQVDEPAFMSVRDAESIALARSMLAPVLTAIRAAGAIPMIHCCARPSRELFHALATPLSLDASTYGTECSLISHDESLPGLALGLAAVHASPATESSSMVNAFREHFGANADSLAAQSLVTPVCGLALASASEARRSFELAAQCANEISAGRQLGTWR
jgi:hypothetical protein